MAVWLRSHIILLCRLCSLLPLIETYCYLWWVKSIFFNTMGPKKKDLFENTSPLVTWELTEEKEMSRSSTVYIHVQEPDSSVVW